MASNRKLTAVLKGRTVTAVEPRGAEVAVRFGDGSVMTVQTAPGGPVPALPGGPGAAGASGAAGAPQGARVRAVRQQGTRLDLDLEGGGTLEFETAEPTASVLVRDADRQLEYAD